MDHDQLVLQISSDIAAGLKPFLLIATAGSTNLGTVDPLVTLAKIAQEHHLWFHVDGAYGGFFKLCPETQNLFDGLSHANSIVLDPHKGLFLPYGVGAVLIRDKKSPGQDPPPAYLQDRHQGATSGGSGLPPSPMDVSLELTRPFRSLRLWLALKVYGLDTFTAALREKLALTRYVREALQQIPAIEVVPAGDLSVTAFRVAGDTDGSKTRQLLKEINAEGPVFLTSTHFWSQDITSTDLQQTHSNDLFVIRIAILSFRTHRDTIDTTIKLIKKHGAKCL
jgi:glutamate/tyrosine decarboxylase-like PLP-dependent enzyme